jgi:hypothetical protein
MAVFALSPCLKAFVLALSAPLRAQLRTLLYTAQGILKAQIAQNVALLGRNDISKALYKNAVDQIESYLRPIEQAMNLIPFSDMAGCVEGNVMLSNVQNIYFQYKGKAQDFAYKYAQYGFASTYATKTQDELINALNQITGILDQLDNLGSSLVTIGTRVQVYSINKIGTVTGLPSGNQVTVTLDIPPPATITTGAGDVGVVNA